MRAHPGTCGHVWARKRVWALGLVWAVVRAFLRSPRHGAWQVAAPHRKLTELRDCPPPAGYELLVGLFFLACLPASLALNSLAFSAAALLAAPPALRRGPAAGAAAGAGAGRRGASDGARSLAPSFLYGARPYGHTPAGRPAPSRRRAAAQLPSCRHEAPPAAAQPPAHASCAGPGLHCCHALLTAPVSISQADPQSPRRSQSWALGCGGAGPAPPRLPRPPLRLPRDPPPPRHRPRPHPHPAAQDRPRPHPCHQRSPQPQPQARARARACGAACAARRWRRQRCSRAPSASWAACGAWTWPSTCARCRCRWAEYICNEGKKSGVGGSRTRAAAVTDRCLCHMSGRARRAGRGQDRRMRSWGEQAGPRGRGERGAARPATLPLQPLAETGKGRCGRVLALPLPLPLLAGRRIEAGATEDPPPHTHTQRVALAPATRSTPT
jgi:hypothetical protein